MRKRIDRALETLGHFLFRRAYWIIGGVLIIVGLGIPQIPNIELRVSVDEFLREDDPAKIEYDEFLERFGRDDVILLAIEPPEVFDLTFLEKLRRLHHEIEDNVPYLRDVKSLVNARETRGENDTLIVGDLLEDWPETAGDLESVRRRALANPLYTGFILSSDSRLTAVTVEIESFADLEGSDDAFAGFEDGTGRETERNDSPTRITGSLENEVVDAVTEIVRRYESPEFKIYLSGSPVINRVMMGSLVRDVSLFTVLSIGVIAGVLFVVFRRVVAVVVPLVVAILSLVATLATMGTLRIPAMPISEVVPSFLLSVGVGGSVHLIVIFQQRLRAGASREDAIADALGHSGLPIIMTALTTAGGLASFMAAELTPIFIFGVVAPLGILLSLFLTLFLCPALLAVLPLRHQAAPDNQDTFTIRLLTRLGDFSTAHAGRVLAVCTILLMIALIGILQLRFSFDSLEWFPEDNPAKVASRKIDSEFGGAMGIELLIETGEENGLHDPELLQRIERARKTSRDLEVGAVKAGKSVSIIDIVKETHQALHGGTEDAYIIPNDRRLVSQELLLFENSGTDDLEDVVDSQFSLARYTIRAPMVDGSHYAPFGDELLRIFRKHIGDRAEVSISGLTVVMSRSFTATIETMMRSYIIALAIITPLMMIVLGSLRLGLIAMIPNLFPIILTLGLMGALGLPIEIFSLLIGSVALGLAVDDTIHFMHGFRRGYARTGDVEVAVRETLRTTGQALLFTSVVLSLGFLIYVFSDLVNLTNFGFLTAFAIIMAFLADVLLAPALMTVTARYSSIQIEAPDADAA